MKRSYDFIIIGALFILALSAIGVLLSVTETGNILWLGWLSSMCGWILVAVYAARLS